MPPIFLIIYSPIKFFIIKKYGKTYLKGGYVVIRNLFSKDEYEHRMIAVKIIRRKLTPIEEVHHINHNKRDNRVENLCIMNQMAHRYYHSWEKWIRENQSRKVSINERISRIKNKYPDTVFLIEIKRGLFR